MVKVVELTFDDGEIWQIPLAVIAKNRTDHYASKHEDDFNYQDEIDYVMNDDYVGHDWLQNNMEYDEFKDSLKVIPAPANKKEKDFCNADAEIKEVD